jgi:hypothetical protein
MHVNWTALGMVLITGLVSGVGVVVLFTLGIRGLSDHTDAKRTGRTITPGLALAVLSFALSAAIVGLGIYVIVAG